MFAAPKEHWPEYLMEGAGLGIYMREIEVGTDVSMSRIPGFHEYQPTLGSFLDLFARLRRARIIPA
jgi:hypothetical protein